MFLYDSVFSELSFETCCSKFHNFQRQQLLTHLSSSGKNAKANGELRLHARRSRRLRKVGDNDRFVSLLPGQEWTTTATAIDEDEELNEDPRDTKIGDKFRFWYTGLELDWWDWGAKEDHKETSVLLSCTLYSAVCEPKDNDGRPKLIVPASNIIELTVVE
jgi:hypothetical protein